MITVLIMNNATFSSYFFLIRRTRARQTNSRDQLSKNKDYLSKWRRNIMRQRYVSLRAHDEASRGSDIHPLSFVPWWNSNRQAAVILELASACSQGPDLVARRTSETIRKMATPRNVIVAQCVHTYVYTSEYNRSQTHAKLLRRRW